MVDDHIVVKQRSKRLEVFRARLGVLFGRLPMLCGFHVSETLSLVEVTVDTWPGAADPPGLVEYIYSELEDLVADRSDDGANFLRGKTFARALH